jgi:hypothetical protein
VSETNRIKWIRINHKAYMHTHTSRHTHAHFDRMHNDILWPDPKTTALISREENSTDSGTCKSGSRDAPTDDNDIYHHDTRIAIANGTPRECLFCLEGTTTDSDGDSGVIGDFDEDNEDIRTTIACDRKQVLDLGDLFPCECCVYTHGHCLQQWLETEPKCPMCKCTMGVTTNRLVYDELFPNAYLSAPQYTDVIGEETNQVHNNVCPYNTCQTFGWCSLSTIIVYFLLYWSSPHYG